MVRMQSALPWYETISSPSLTSGNGNSALPAMLFTNRSVLFLGPANTSCSVSMCKFDTVIVTNAMIELLKPPPCSASIDLIVVANRFYGHVLANDTALSRRLTSTSFRSMRIFLNSEIIVKELIAKRNLSLESFYLMPWPSTVAHPNTLGFVVRTLAKWNVSRFHITGVTFYDRGQQYVEGYYRAAISFLHDRRNKDYVLNFIGNTSQATIDYPRCLSDVHVE